MKICLADDYFIKKLIKYKYGILFGFIYFTLMLNRVKLKEISPDFIVFLLNTMPNFLSGIFFSVTFYDIFQKHWKKTKSIFFAILFTGTWLTIEEYYDIFSHNKYFDYYDILMSWVGCIIAYLIVCGYEKKSFMSPNIK
jgi:hypothetical protein